MFSRSSWLHLRIPFSYFLLPVFLFAVAISPNISEPRLLWVFVILHLLLYPASNGFNSYFDKDEKSIGGLKNPPKVNKGLYYLALIFDAIALLMGYFIINPLFAMMLFVYGMVFKSIQPSNDPVEKVSHHRMDCSWCFSGCIYVFNVLCWIK